MIRQRRQLSTARPAGSSTPAFGIEGDPGLLLWAGIALTTTPDVYGIKERAA